jgi:hypothetical protein
MVPRDRVANAVLEHAGDRGLGERLIIELVDPMVLVVRVADLAKPSLAPHSRCHPGCWGRQVVADEEHGPDERGQGQRDDPGDRGRRRTWGAAAVR